MSDIQINKVWDYLLSNNELTDSLANISVVNGGKVIFDGICKKLSSMNAQEREVFIKYNDCRSGDKLQIGSANNKNYGNKIFLYEDGKIKIPKLLNGIINLIYFKNIKTSLTSATFNFINNYQYNTNQDNVGIKVDENLELTFKNLINNLENQDLRNIIRFTKLNINDNTLVIKNKPINAIIYLESVNDNYYLSFPVGSNIILIVYDSYVSCMISFNNDKDIVCPAEKICPPEKVCPVNIIPYIFIIILIIIVFTLAIFLILKKNNSTSTSE